MPKIRDSYILDETQNSIVRASRRSNNTAIRNLGEAVSEKPVDASKIEKVAGNIAEFNNMIDELTNGFDVIVYAGTFLMDSLNQMEGAGRMSKKGGYTLKKIPTAETPKERYYQYMRQAPRLYTNSVMGGGRLVGGADRDIVLNLGEDEEEEVDPEVVDVEDEEDGLSQLSSLSSFGSSRSGIPAFIAPDSVPSAPENVGTSDFTIPKMVDNIGKLTTLSEKARRFYKLKVIPDIRVIPRKDFSPSVFEIGQIKEKMEGELDAIIEELRVYLLFSKGEATSNKVFNGYQKLKESVEKLYEEVDNSVRSYVEPRRTGAGRMHRQNTEERLLAGALGGVPILSSILQYQHIPTKYLL